jgi:hypothetical protein
MDLFNDVAPNQTFGKSVPKGLAEYEYEIF